MCIAVQVIPMLTYSYYTDIVKENSYRPLNFLGSGQACYKCLILI